MRKITYSNSFRGRKAKEGGSSRGFLSLLRNIRGCFAGGEMDPRFHPFNPKTFPREFLQAFRLEPWRFDILSGSLPRRDGILHGYRASTGPIRFAVLVFPFAEAMGNRYSVKTFLRRSFPKAFPSTTPKGSFKFGVRDESKGQIL
jgi:hypothetical protein